jgi:hypothetical protein
MGRLPERTETARLPSASLTARRPRLSRGLAPEAWPVALFVLWALLPLAILFVHVAGSAEIGSGGRVFNGADQLDVVDQLQYLAWVRDAGQHVLISNQFDLAPSAHVYLHPMFALSGLAWRAGASLQLAYLAWRPIALAVIIIGFLAYVRRTVGPNSWLRATALFVALFFATPAWAISGWGDLGSPRTHFGLDLMGKEMFPGDYTSLGIVIGLMPLYLLGIERLLDASRRRPGRSAAWYVATTAFAGGLTAWIHPWQGLTLLAIVGGLVAWMRPWRRAALLALPVLATAAPLGYYFVLSHADATWHARSIPNDYPHFGWWFFLTIVPPLLLALPGVRWPAVDVQTRIVRLWPVAALATYFALDRSWFYQAYVGISLPLAVLAVTGMSRATTRASSPAWTGLRRAGLPVALGAVLVASFTVPGSALYVKQLHDEASQHFLATGEASALRYLADSPAAGGVLAREPLGSAVPAFAGRKTWVGHPQWTPDWGRRAALADALFRGRFGAAAARRLVEATGARFLLADCHASANLGRLLDRMVTSTRRFGCAVLYQVSPGGGPAAGIARAGSSAGARLATRGA